MVTAERSEAADLGVTVGAKDAWEVAPAAFPFRLQLPSEWELTDDRLLELGALNEEWYLEADCEGGLFMAPPPGPLSGERELLISSQILFWSTASGRGRVFPSATFRLPNGWRRAPDAAWISDERLESVAVGDEGVWTVCPDFFVEVRSASDRLDPLQVKMEMWVEQGARLAWLVDPKEELVWAYRPEQEVERLERPDSVTATEIADDLVIDFSRIWPDRKVRDGHG
jgi:Uma2 family endonuclease